MSKVLLLVGHPDLSASRHNGALVDAVRDLEHVTVRDLSALYPDFEIDGDAERALLAEHDVIVFQHPLRWYSTPAIFRQWQDAVLTHGWAFNYEGKPTRTTGKKAVLAVTIGGQAEDYSLDGSIGFTMDQILAPWHATLSLCQFDLQPLFVLHGAAFGLSDEDVFSTAKDYRELLASFA
ncbi:NAD(P)H-dependent oxidoreductase [Streptomyces sp. NL15-2K]|uniref:NAD(P)H-dependent oxidoreductase n=1 Tax=Streptomyces sp. NL15-2K TaxID=376149 RepID=UPI000F57BF4C|nr:MULTISPECIES: NAD(P)H-dependent oxidoreductase [Actinomycetes]WKX06098.1 NAD(P)H-dependent oxidoreductase [Kutzneria buriramensis]GCB52757.1 glutathione-regulated potassium-efflux system ancillary protein kefG [Streptomyces sp. NL15-2K]